MAAGMGVRMLPLTENMPKSLLRVAGIPIIERTLNELPDEIDEVIIIVGYLADQIREHFKDSKKKLRFVDCEPKGTAWAVKLCQEIVSGDFLVLNGDDLYSKKDLIKLIQTASPAMLAIDASHKPGFPEEYSRFGRLVIDSESNFRELKTSTQDLFSPFYVNVGAYKLNLAYFDYPLVKIKNGEYGLPHTIFQMLDKHKIKIVPAEFWAPIGFPEDIERAEELLDEYEK
ncbi:MAG: nucleotidyltransferase family protein [Candidatus Doudnabacteria bacterium]|nr:nucleotidyltransferase family protein [Candidatus Doudnabacteria bacterium]